MAVRLGILVLTLTSHEVSDLEEAHFYLLLFLYMTVRMYLELSWIPRCQLGYTLGCSVSSAVRWGSHCLLEVKLAELLLRGAGRESCGNHGCDNWAETTLAMLVFQRPGKAQNSGSA